MKRIVCIKMKKKEQNDASFQKKSLLLQSRVPSVPLGRHALKESLGRAIDIILCRNVEISKSLGIMAICSHLGLLYPYGHDIPKGVGYCLLLSDRSFHNLGTIMAIVSTLFPLTRSTNR